MVAVVPSMQVDAGMGGMMQTKCCRKCGVVKGIENFTRAVRNPDGRHSYCKPCRSKANAAQQRAAKGGDGRYVWPRPAAEIAANAALNGCRVVRPVGAVFAPSLGLSA